MARLGRGHPAGAIVLRGPAEAAALGPVREFDGVDDFIRLSSGGISGLGSGAWSIAVLIKKPATGFGSPFHMNNAATPGTNRLAIETGNAQWLVHVGGAFVTLSGAVLDNIWQLAIHTKATGTVQVRSHYYNYDTSTWTHGTSGSSIGNAANAADSIQVGRFGTTDELTGKIAAVAAYDFAISDGQAETMEAALQAWADLAPVGLWPLNQASVGTPVEDLIGTADEAAITGTAVNTSDAPVPFDFDVTVGFEVADSDTATISDAVTARGIADADTAAVTEQVASRSLAAGDGITVGDQVTARALTAADSIGLSDAVNTLDQGATPKADIDSLTVTEQVSARGLAGADTATITDAVSARAAAAGDTATVVDAVTARAAGSTDQATISDAVSARAVAAGDQASIIEQVSSRQLTDSDTIGISDAAVVDQGTGDKLASDTVIVADQVTARTLTASDSIGVTDTVSMLQQTKAATDSIGITDAVAARALTAIDLVDVAEAIVARAVRSADAFIVIDGESLDTHEQVIPGELAVVGAGPGLAIAGDGPGLAVAGDTVSTTEVG
jgi:hypothetical protein